jgi:proliferating cell nuclear antigen
MLKSVLCDAKRWRDILNLVSPLLEEAEFRVSAEGMKLRAMDSSHVAMVDLNLPNSFFDKYECDKLTELRFNVKSILDMLETMGAKDAIELNYLDEQMRLIIRLRGEYERVFNLATLAIEREFDREPKAVGKVRARVQAASLKRVILDSQKIGDSTSIETKTDLIVFRTVGLAGDVVSTFKRGEAPLTELSVEEESKSSYSLDLLSVIMKNASLVSDLIDLEYSTNQVLKMSLVMPQGSLHFYLSPMLETS